MNESRKTPSEPPFPDVRTAFLLTIGAIVAGGLVGVLFIDLGLIAAEGLGTALGVGGVATLAARRVAEPQSARIGLASLDWRVLPLILCLAPAVLLASELDNFAYDWSPAEAEAGKTDAKPAEEPAAAKDDAKAKAETPAERPTATAAATEGPATDEAAASTKAEPAVRPETAQDTETAAQPETGTGTGAATATARGGSENAEAASKPPVKPAPRKAPVEEEPEPLLDPNDPFNMMEVFIVSVGIAPVIHEFLFRGVIQQGLIGQLGFARGITLTALLWTMVRPVPSTSPARFAAAFVAFFAMGWLLGLARAASGSILGSILLASLWAAVGFASIALDGRTALPGMNVEGTHLPAELTIVSLALVGWAAHRVYGLALERTAPGAGR